MIYAQIEITVTDGASFILLAEHSGVLFRGDAVFRFSPIGANMFFAVGHLPARVRQIDPKFIKL